MSAVEESVLRILNGDPLRLLLAVHLFAFPTFRRRPFFGLKAVLTALPLLLGFEIVYQLSPGGLLPGNPLLDRALLLLPAVWLYLTLRICYVCTPRERLFSTSSALALQNLAFSLFWIAKTVAGFPETSWPALWVSWGMLLLIYGTVLLLFWDYMLDREGHTLPMNRVSQNAIVIVLFVLFFTRRFGGTSFDVYLGLAYSFADVLALLMQIGLIRETDLTLKNEIVEQLLASEQKKQRMTAENIELINRKCHDLKHQIEALRHISSDDERNAYIKQVEDAVLFYESAVKTSNETLDLILMEKQLYCKEHGITLTGVCDGARLNFISTPDLYALFGNALENAIESVSGEAAENRIISFRAGVRGDFLSIHIENYLGHALTMRDGLPLTTKNDLSYHGFGMLSIRHIVDKYGGTMSIRTDQKLFRLDILLPCAEPAEA